MEDRLFSAVKGFCETFACAVAIFICIMKFVVKWNALSECHQGSIHIASVMSSTVRPDLMGLGIAEE